MNLKPNKHKIISFNTTTMTSLGFIIVGTLPPPLIKGGGDRTFAKLSHLGGANFFARKGGINL